MEENHILMQKSLNSLRKSGTFIVFTNTLNLYCNGVSSTKPVHEVPSTLLAIRANPNPFLPHLLAPDFYFISTPVHMTGVKPAPHSHIWAELRAGPQPLSSLAEIMPVLSKKFHTDVFRLSR